jgi:hypothetical protein
MDFTHKLVAILNKDLPTGVAFYIQETNIAHD